MVPNAPLVPVRVGASDAAGVGDEGVDETGARKASGRGEDDEGGRIVVGAAGGGAVARDLTDVPLLTEERHRARDVEASEDAMMEEMVGAHTISSRLCSPRRKPSRVDSVLFCSGLLRSEETTVYWMLHCK